MLSSAPLLSSRVNVAVLALFAALRNAKMMRSVRALDGMSQPRIALAFSAALRSSAIFALALRSSSLLHLPSVLTKVIVRPNHPHPTIRDFHWTIMIARTLCLNVADEQHPLKISTRPLTATKRNPEEETHSGLQVVASACGFLCPGDGVSGDGLVARIA